MSDIESDWEGEDELGERPYGGRPYGGRPYGGRPYGGRPYGGRPYGGRPYGGRLYEERPYGGRPYGGRPYGGRPYGGRPYGGRPYGGRRSADGGIDIDEWSADIGEGVCDRSAVIRLGATVAFGSGELQLPAPVAVGGIRAPGGAGLTPSATSVARLLPGEWRLEASVAVPVESVPVLIESPDVSAALKADLAEELALRADQAFLGTAAGGPPGIGGLPRFPGPATGGGQRLKRLRDLVATVRAAQTPRNAGWVVHPQALDDIARFLTRNGILQAATGRSLDSLALLCPDRADGGTLLGFPFITSAAAIATNRPRVYFSADWEEAWIGFDSSFVTVVVSGRPSNPAGQLVITASMPLGFTLRKSAAFGWAVA
jgi:Phage capsid family